MSLAKYITQQNKLAEFYPWKRIYDIKNLSTEDKQQLSLQLSSDLSPESLSRDGELRGAKLQAKLRLLHAAKDDLEILDIVVVLW